MDSTKATIKKLRIAISASMTLEIVETIFLLLWLSWLENLTVAKLLLFVQGFLKKFLKNY